MKHISILLITLLFFSCKKDQEASAQRTYRMGFQNSAPTFNDTALFIQSLNLWTVRADAAIISTEVPWNELFSGVDAGAYVVDHYKDLAAFYRSKNLILWVYVDPQNGLDRTADATALIATGKSIAQAAVQEQYRRFVIAMDSILKPEHLGLALETNLIRFSSSRSVYGGVKQAANDVARELKLKNSKAKLSVSIQVEMAWGVFGGVAFQGIGQDLIDFPFIEEIGFSSYPYFIFGKPAEIPTDYYSRLLLSNKFPVFISEGGWASKSVSTPSISFISSNEIQKEYIERHHELLQSIQATALFQLTFTDIDITSLLPPIPATLGYFTSLGLLDINMQPKPSLSAWDANFQKQLK
ncbi:MAG: hypothetical protein H7122_11165 [Chitinophagaceae bacterium]|nr:hypothetical protein [Chitinophagaceae bacterium]